MVGMCGGTDDGTVTADGTSGETAIKNERMQDTMVPIQSTEMYAQLRA
jgi:hypothetical protein